jgi:hypothetical protein
MPKQRWILYEYTQGELILLSKPFRTKEQAERERAKYPERERRKIGVGCIYK